LHRRHLRTPEEPLLEEGRLLDIDASEQEEIVGGEDAFREGGRVGGPEQRPDDEYIEGGAEQDESAEHGDDHCLHANDVTRGVSSARKDLFPYMPR
jgi:hypothetical protein